MVDLAKNVGQKGDSAPPVTATAVRPAPKVSDSSKPAPTQEELSDACKKLKESYGFSFPEGLWRTPDVLRTQCAREFYEPASLKYYSLHTDLDSKNAVTDPKQLLDTESHATLLKYWYPHLKDPPPVQRYLTELILKASHQDKLPIAFNADASKQLGGWADRETHRVLLVDTMSVSEEERKTGHHENGTLTPGTLPHELGHLVMDILYRGHYPDHQGGQVHSDQKNLKAFTTPGAAWAEGFANAMGDLDYGECMNNVKVNDFGSVSEWNKLPLKSRTSNEYIIGAVLRDYIKHGDSGSVDFSRLNLVLRTMKTAGLQQSFTEFVADFRYLNPEESDNFSKILSNYNVADAVGAESNYLVRRLRSFVEEQENLNPSPIGLDSATPRKQAWERLCRDDQVDQKLLDPAAPIQKRIELLGRVESLLKAAEANDFPSGIAF